MPSYIVTCKENASAEEIEETKQHVRDQGGEITHEYSLIKGFAVTFPDGAVMTLESHPHVASVEPDGIMSTQ
ncbi:hypothetical protein F9C07_2171058 [Aspergillus flavus]|uniref:Inhibitor I9 domain-containing protein n=1 Tax=Aspergillus flavus (strain ATCC 200026 / FGSC A1120 / IAM 13836 / NRRL 3357 / JCM 12722 / SRRC 167) TaxID=332952 RepID=A0A7U2N2U6_ASPFN|nr:hypothetical protein AFLA_010309 [Aspergillus flavus NRRL3357]QRD94489.1 hypothetical protein F9C07_2171058 [Aspergillus flavus]